jgi:Flp pilus assembly secretin CpaC
MFFAATFAATASAGTATTPQKPSQPALRTATGVSAPVSAQKPAVPAAPSGVKQAAVKTPNAAPHATVAKATNAAPHATVAVAKATNPAPQATVAKASIAKATMKAAAPMPATAIAKAAKPAPHTAIALIKPTAPVVRKSVVVRKVVVAKAHRVPVKRFAMHRPAAAISIPMDEVRVVAFSQPVQTVYVGNPLIADVTMIDSKHAFLLGKAFGATNIVALNAEGKQVVNDSVTVFGHTGNLVILHRGATQATYACAGSRCEIAPMPGDDKDYYSSRMEQLAAHQDAGMRAASAGR